MILTLVMAIAGQCQIINGRQVCAPAQGSYGAPGYSGGYSGMPGVSYGYGNPFPPVLYQSPRIPAGNSTYYSDVVYLPPATVPRSFAQPQPQTRAVTATPPAVKRAPVGQIVERRPTAVPEPATGTYPTPGPELDEAPIQGRNPYVPRKAPGVPQDESAARQAVPVGRAVGSLTKNVVALPTGQIAEVPTSTESRAAGMPKGEALSPIRSSEGKSLPNFAVNGMLWTPKQKEGYQASPHAEGHAFIESLQVPEAPVPDLIDDSDKIRVTIVSTNPDDRRQAVEDFKKGNGALSPFKDNVLVRSASPESWEVKGVGLSQIKQVSEGKPGVVMQEPGGRVFYATGKYDQKKAAEALRKANPNFDPRKVPGVSSGVCPLGFTHDSWPLIVGTVIVLGLILKSKPQTVIA